MHPARLEDNISKQLGRSVDAVMDSGDLLRSAHAKEQLFQSIRAISSLLIKVSFQAEGSLS